MFSLLRNTGGFHLEAANECRTRLQGAGIDVAEWSDIDRGSDWGSIPTMSSPDSPGSVGRLSHQHHWRHSSTLRSLPGWGKLTKLQHDLKEVPWPASLSSLPQSLLPLVLTRSVFGCCSFVAFGASFPCRLQLAGVASHLTLVAHHRGACAHAGFLGRRGFPPESCAARICREAGA